MTSKSFVLRISPELRAVYLAVLNRNAGMHKETQVDVLLIEDDLTDTELTQYSLLTGDQNLQMRHFTNGEEALDFIFKKKTYWGQAMSDHLKLIILDLNLPTRLGGLDIMKKIKHEEETRSIPIVVLSSSKDLKDIQRAYALGANSYVVKPNGFDGYLNKIGAMAKYWSTVNERPC